jgi:hypothetical protein
MKNCTTRLFFFSWFIRLFFLCWYQFHVGDVSYSFVSMPWVCAVCRAGPPPEVSYSSVLVFGTTDMHKIQKDELEACSSAPLANVTSYCVTCRCVTATFDASVGTSANLVLTHKSRLEYTQHNVFKGRFPSKRNFRKLLRKTSRKYGGSNKSRPLTD